MFHWITQSNKLLLTSILAFTIFVMVFNPSSFVGSEIEYSGSEIPETNYEADLQVKDENTPNEFLMKPTSRNDVRPTVNLPPTPSIWCPVSASTITPVLMDASNSTDPDGSIDEYWWSFGDGIEYIESSLIAPDGSFDGITYHEYKDDGHYNITLNITDNGSSISSVFTSIDIINRPPVPQFTAPDTLFSRETLYLDGSGSFDLDGQVINHTWIIDGIIYSYRSLELINFTKLGSHEIKLMVRDDDGIEAWNMHEIKVSNRLPIARGWYHRNSVYYNGTIEFNATQSIDYGGTIVSYKWDLERHHLQRGILKKRSGLFILQIRSHRQIIQCDHKKGR